MRSGLNKIVPWLWAAVWFTLPLSMKANTISLMVFGLAVIFQSICEKPVFQRKHVILTGLFILFFAWHGAGLLFDPARYEVLKSLERKFSFVAIPVIMLLVTGVKWAPGKWAVRGFFTGLVITGGHMLATALLLLATGRQIDAVTYHEFTRPYALGAIYYSWYLSAAIFLLLFRKMEPGIDRVRLPLGIFFLILLLFSASKLFIALTVPVVLWSIFKNYSLKDNKSRWVVPVIILLIIMAGSVPFISRVSELKNTDLSIVRQNEYTYDTPFNGLTFRILLWRFAGEIMQDENAWLSGTGIGNRQTVLNSYYEHYGVYTGNPDLGDKGYLGYNFHNQYLEVMVGTGIPGLLILLLIIIFIFTFEKNKLLFPLIAYVTVVLFFITESVLERQAGIVFFCLIWTLRVNVPESLKS